MSRTLREQLAPFARGTAKACTGKLQYRSEAYAQKVAAARMRMTDVELHVYACAHCGQWHLTKMDRHI